MAGKIEAGRVHFAAREWSSAYGCLADATEPGDLERLATSAFLIGELDAYFAALERAYHRYAERGHTIDAARCAIWLGLMRMRRGDVGQGGGWLARAGRLVEEYGQDCAEAGYLMVPRMFECEMTGDLERAVTVAAEVAAIGRRFADHDLTALAVHSEGQYLIELGRPAEGLARLDEAMVAVTADELSPIANGIVYCGVILGCRAAYDVDRAAEWTTAMSRWCDEQPEMLAFAGHCRVHRAEILGLRGRWGDAQAEVDRLASGGADPDASRGEACYLLAELHRMQGRHRDAEDAYRRASAAGRNPQPGLALLRLATGGVQAAATMVELALRETQHPVTRPALLAAASEILCASGDVEGAERAATELADLAAANGGRLLTAMAAQAAGRVALARGDADGARLSLRNAANAWQQLAAPYELARTRTMLGRALAELGDSESAELEFDAARAVFAELHAVADLAALDATRGRDASAPLLTARELEVLRLVAKGMTNRSIAAELVLSERTVDRHVSNIFAKIGVASRTAATAYAIERQLV